MMNKMFSLKAALSVVAAMFAMSAISQSSTTYTTAGTYTFTVSTGQQANVKVEAWGAGGGGGTNVLLGVRGTGGGGGAYASKELTLNPGNYTVVVGKGGLGAISEVFTSRAAQDGGNSSFNGTAVVANGGGHGNKDNGGVGAAATTGYTSFSGGNGGDAEGGTSNGSGGGGSAWSNANGQIGGNSTPNVGGNGKGGDGQGKGGDGGSSSVIPGNGIAPGGGGGGKNVAYGTAGNGADGKVVITVNSTTALAVNFGAIDAVVIGNVLNVSFDAVNETNNDHFNVQLSENGVDFTTVATIQSQYADGNSATNTTYSTSINLAGKMALGLSVFSLLGIGIIGFNKKKSFFLYALLTLGLSSFIFVSCNKDADVNAVSKEGKAYLRIQQVDKNGATSNSKVITVAKK